MNIDRDRLRADRRAVEAEIRELKRLIRGTPVPWPRNWACDLRGAKARATLLCAIAAHARGRLHLLKCTKRHAHLGLPPLERFTLEDQAKWIGERWRTYERTAA